LHMTIHLLHSCLALSLIPCRSLPVHLIMFKGFRCRPHLRV
jgi:hypothetical protein